MQLTLGPRGPALRSELPSTLPAASLLKVLVVWDETSNKVRNYRIFEKVSGLAEGPEREGAWLGAGQSPKEPGHPPASGPYKALPNWMMGGELIICLIK